MVAKLAAEEKARAVEQAIAASLEKELAVQAAIE